MWIYRPKFSESLLVVKEVFPAIDMKHMNV